MRRRVRARLARRHHERSELVEGLDDALRGVLPLRLIAGGVALVLGAARLADGSADGALGVVLGVVLWSFGTWRELLLAAGCPRLAGCVAWADDWTWGRDHPGSVPATLALGALRGSRSGEPWLAAWLRNPDKLTAGTVLAAAMSRLAAGDDPDAVLLLSLVPDYDASVCPPIVRRLATELRMVAAADRGDLRAVLAVADEPRSARTPLTHLLCLVARRARGEPVSAGVLRAAAWLAAPLGGALPLVDRAAALVGPGGSARLRSALVAEARGWEQRLTDPALTDDWRARASALRARVDPVAAVRAGCAERLAARLEEAVVDGPDPGDAGELWAEVVRVVSDRRLDRLRALSEELARRTKAKAGLPLLDELLASLRVDEAAEALVVVDPGRRLAAHFLSWGPLVNHAVWLHNERGQTAAANALYRRQHRRAVAAGHPQATELLARNLECGP